MRNFMAVSIIWFFTVGFWGVAFPEFALTQDAVELVSAQGNVIATFDSEEDFMKLLNSESDKVEIRCKLWEMWQQK